MCLRFRPRLLSDVDVVVAGRVSGSNRPADPSSDQPTAQKIQQLDHECHRGSCEYGAQRPHSKLH